MTGVEAWQEALVQEQAAVYGFGLVGGRLGPTDELARASLVRHRERVVACEEALRNLGAVPDPGSAAYRPSAPVTTDQRARDLALSLEVACAAAYANLVADPELATRRIGAAWLRSSAIDQSLWSGQLPALPGLVSA